MLPFVAVVREKVREVCTMCVDLSRPLLIRAAGMPTCRQVKHLRGLLTYYNNSLPKRDRIRIKEFHGGKGGKGLGTYSVYARRMRRMRRRYRQAVHVCL